MYYYKYLLIIDLHFNNLFVHLFIEVGSLEGLSELKHFYWLTMMNSKISHVPFKPDILRPKNLNTTVLARLMFSVRVISVSDRARHPALPVRLVGHALPAAEAGGGGTLAPASCRTVLPRLCGLLLPVVQPFLSVCLARKHSVSYHFSYTQGWSAESLCRTTKPH